MAKNNRDEFPEKTKLQIAKRAGWLCSDPACRRPTVGATSDGQGEILLGEASHTETAALRFIDLVLDGKVANRGNDIWQMARDVARLMQAHPVVRTRVYALLRNDPRARSELFMRAVDEAIDTDGLLLLVELEKTSKRRFVSQQTVAAAITERVPVRDWAGAYSEVPVPATGLRKQLLSMTTDGGQSDAAARVLRLIDLVRDNSGSPEGEPRHPDLDSDRAWPIITPDLEAWRGD